MSIGYAGGVHLLGGFAQFGEDAAGFASGELLQDVPGDGEYGPVVDAQDVRPGCQGFRLRVGDAGAADQSQVFHLRVHSGDALVKDQGVGDDGAGHAPGLRHVGHPQQPGNGRGDVGTQRDHFVEDHRRPLDALLQGGRGGVHRLLRHGHQADQVGQVGNGTFQPAGFGKPAAVLIQHGVGKTGGCQRVAQVAGEPDGIGITQGDGGFDGVSLVYHPQAQTGVGVCLAGAHSFVFGFNHHRSAVRGGNQIVQLQAGASLDKLGVLGAHLTAGQHPAEQVAQLVIGAGLAMSGPLGEHSQY